MDSPWIAALFALFVWWFATGAILIVVKRADLAGGAAHLNAVLAGLPLLGLGWYGLVATMTSDSVASVYGAFLSALAIWGWFELAFLCGVVTGPNVRPCPPDVARWERFLRAWGTIAHSEMALIATAIVMVAVCREAPNPFGLWTFLVLFCARISAKLNVYLGVPNINVEFLPAPVRHLASHFRIAPMNAFFPVAVTALTFAVACWLERALASDAGTGAQVGFALLAAFTALALLEHWMMVVPLQDARLWRWLMPRPEELTQHRLPETRVCLSEDAHGLR
jgi:putative photosynthetic complex assembly protein 2